MPTVATSHAAHCSPRHWLPWCLILMGLLATAHPPAALAQAGDARTVAAQADLRALATALETCALDTTYYVSLETLNDLDWSAANPLWDNLTRSGGPYVLRPTEGRFRPARVNLATAFNRWQGPYMTYQDGQTQTGTTPYDQGSPLDPWGTPYYFFSPLGLVRGDAGTITLELYGDAFDRYTLVSLGPDGVQSTDDLIYRFGAGVSGPVLSSVGGSLVTYDPVSPNVFAAPESALLTVRGEGLGATAAGAQLFFGETALPAAESWSASAVTVRLPAGLHGTAALTLRRGTSVTNALTLTITQPTTPARHWSLYD